MTEKSRIFIQRVKAWRNTWHIIKMWSIGFRKGIRIKQGKGNRLYCLQQKGVLCVKFMDDRNNV